MKVDVTVRRKIVFNGKEYDSAEALPASVRAAYEKAVADGVVPGAATTNSRASGRITVDGKTYDSPESMPPEVRRLYEDAMAAVQIGGAPTSPRPMAAPSQAPATEADAQGLARLANSPTPLGPGSDAPRSRASMALLVGLVLLAILAYLILR
jgi:hypothetical protein